MAYDFLRELGRGEYAQTYLVRRRTSGQLLACKEILKGDTPQTVARAAREAEVHSSLSDHPNIAGENPPSHTHNHPLDGLTDCGTRTQLLLRWDVGTLQAANRL